MVFGGACVDARRLLWLYSLARQGVDTLTPHMVRFVRCALDAAHIEALGDRPTLTGEYAAECCVVSEAAFFAADLAEGGELEQLARALTGALGRTTELLGDLAPGATTAGSGTRLDVVEECRLDDRIRPDVGGRGEVVEVGGHAAAEINARMSSTRHTVTRGDSFTGAGNLPSFTPAHQVLRPTGMKSSTCVMRRKPVSGRFFIARYPQMFRTMGILNGSVGAMCTDSGGRRIQSDDLRLACELRVTCITPDGAKRKPGTGPGLVGGMIVCC